MLSMSEKTELKMFLWFFLGIVFAGFAFFVAFSSLGIDAVYHTSFYATFENGETVKVENIIAVPILAAEQIDRMWPEYYVETKVNVGGKEITLRSKPFLFCDNPELEGTYAGRDVYCVLKGK